MILPHQKQIHRATALFQRRPLLPRHRPCLPLRRGRPLLPLTQHLVPGKSSLQMKIVDFESPGTPDVLRIKEVPNPTYHTHEILIQVAAAGLNIYDTWRRQGIPYYLRDTSVYLGYEFSGKVVAVGSNVSEFKVGDDVCAIYERGGGYAEFVAVPVTRVLRIPSGVSLVNAAAFPHASYLTFYALSISTNITAGKIVLIHGAAGGSSIIALQYAKHFGCDVFALVGTEEELQLCKTLGAKVCINYKKEDFCKRVKAETGGKGVDIILDDSGRDHFQKNLDCLARGGSLVIFGLKIESYVDFDLSVLMEKDINVIGGDLHSLNLKERKSLKSDVAAKFWPLIEDGHIKPIIGKIFSFAEAGEAHRALEESSIPGKLLLVP